MNRVDSDQFDRFYLIQHLHVARFDGHGRGRPKYDHESGNKWTEFPYYKDNSDLSKFVLTRDLGKLDDDHGTDDQRHGDYHVKGLDCREVHLFDDYLVQQPSARGRSSDKKADDPAGEGAEVEKVIHAPDGIVAEFSEKLV